jgi:hypothetical protein
MQIIELQGDENITVIRNLLQRATDSEVLLSVPKGCEALENNEVNLMLLRRWADNLALCVGLVIEDRSTQVLAKEAGLVVLPSIEEGQKADLRLLDRRRRRRRGLPPRPALNVLLRPSTTPATKKPRVRALLDARAGLLVAAAAFLTLVVALWLFILPSATVTLRPVSEPVEATMEILGLAGLAEINYGLAQVPARTLFVEQESLGTIATTNKRDVPDGHAQGTVVFANKTTIPVTITKGTVLRTSYGENVRFFSIADAWLSGDLYATVRVGILAAEPGPSGNVPPLTVNVVEGELAAQVDVLNDSRTTGGTVRRVSTVDGEDKVKLRAKLSERIQEEAYSELTSALARGEFIPPDSLVITVLAEEFDHKIDDVTDQLGLSMRVKVSGLAVSAADGEKLLLGLLEQRMKPGYRLLTDTASFERGSVITATPAEALFRMSARAAIAPSIDTKAVSSAVAGKTIEAATDYLSNQFQLISEPGIELSGGLLRRLPWWAARIRVRVSTG